MSRVSGAVLLLARSFVAVKILRVLAVHGRLYTRRVLQLAGVHGDYGLRVLRQLEALGLVERREGELCERGGQCRRVVWNTITREGLEALRELGALGDVEEVVAEEHVRG